MLTRRTFLQGALLAAIGADTVMSASPARAASLTAPQPRTAADYAKVFNSLPPDEWLAADAATSIRLPDGRELWMFGDTFRTGAMDHNSFILQNGGNFTVLNNPMPENSAGEWFWPGPAVIEGSALRVFCSRVRANGSDPLFPFKTVGTSIKSFTPGTMKLSTLVTNPQSAREITWAASVYKSTTWIYIFGSKLGYLGHDWYIARVPIGQLTELNKWRYWNGSNWSWFEGEAKAIPVDGQSSQLGAGGSVVKNPSGGYDLITKSFEFIGNEVKVFHAPVVQGPYTYKKTVATFPAYDDKHMTYLASVHPTVPLSSGKMLLSVCNNDTEILTRPDLGRPSFFEVTL